MPLCLPFMPRFFFLLITGLWSLAAASSAQAQAPAPPDTSRRVRLPEATVTGYGQQLPLRRVAASIGVVDARSIEQLSPTALTAAVNTLPGVRLEERATASYRLSIRGSTLRSPFGVRNVKVYYHDIPFTEASGSTPLNLLDPATIGRIEVLRGPAGSAYGAGTGGAVRFETPASADSSQHVQASTTVGSFGLRRYSLRAETAGAAGSLRLQYAHQSLDGYRQNSALQREVLTLDAELSPAGPHRLAVHGLYADIGYQLPGGLTRAEYEQDPRQARPDTGPSRPGTVAQQASYAARSALLGITHEFRISEKLSSTATAYGSGTIVRTPYLVDFERNTVLGGGGRAVLRYTTRLAGRVLRLSGGGEVQGSFENARNYENRRGSLGALRYDDEINTLTGFAFAQADAELPAGLLATVGLSYNRLRYRIRRGAGSASGAYELERNFRPELSPRLALLKELTPALSVYASFSTGFSPPTEEEIRPSSGLINTDLQAERGRSYELGLRGSLLQQYLRFDLALFDQQIRQTITTQGADNGVTLFANTGTTRQRGVEVALSGWLWQAANPRNQSIPIGLRAWLSYAYNYFRFEDYQPGGQDFSGNHLTGTAPHTLSAGLDLAAPLGFFLVPSLNHQSAIPLNDANTEYAASYWTFAGRLGWRTALRRSQQPGRPGPLEMTLYVGVDNATDRRYSLGNDLNAFGGRYFQPAPGRSFYGGASISLNRRLRRLMD